MSANTQVRVYLHGGTSCAAADEKRSGEGERHSRVGGEEGEPWAWCERVSVVRQREDRTPGLAPPVTARATPPWEAETRRRCSRCFRFRFGRVCSGCLEFDLVGEGDLPTATGGELDAAVTDTND
jgi:hypothetical protein